MSTPQPKGKLIVREFMGCSLDFAAPTPELRADDEGAPEGSLYGRIVPYNYRTQVGVDWFEVFEKGALDKTMREHRAGIRLYSTHNTRDKQPIGSVERSWSRDDGMWVRFSLNQTNDANDVRELVRTGDATGLSVGFWSIRARNEYDDERTLTVYQQEVRLDHVAFVARPAYPDAQVAYAREEEPEAEVVEAVEPEPAPEPEPSETPLRDEWVVKAALLERRDIG